MQTYIYQNKDWPNFTWNAQVIISILSRVRNKQGLLTGKMEALGFNLQNEAYLETLSQDVIKSSEIEGEILNTEQVRSSIARKLGINIGGLVDSDRNVDASYSRCSQRCLRYCAAGVLSRTLDKRGSQNPLPDRQNSQ